MPVPVTGRAPGGASGSHGCSGAASGVRQQMPGNMDAPISSNTPLASTAARRPRTKNHRNTNATPAGLSRRPEMAGTAHCPNRCSATSRRCGRIRCSQTDGMNRGDPSCFHLRDERVENLALAGHMRHDRASGSGICVRFSVEGKAAAGIASRLPRLIKQQLRRLAAAEQRPGRAVMAGGWTKEARDHPRHASQRLQLPRFGAGACVRHGTRCVPGLLCIGPKPGTRQTRPRDRHPRRAAGAMSAK